MTFIAGQVLTAAEMNANTPGPTYDMSGALGSHPIAHGGSPVSTSGSASYTIPVAGWYQVNVGILASGAGGDGPFELKLTKNGTQIANAIGDGGSASGNITLTVSKAVQCAIGDVLGLTFSNGGAYSVTFVGATSQNNWFDVTFIYA
jgi:hypothetical protein